MIKDTTCKELIIRLISKHEFSKAETILSFIKSTNERLKSIRLLLEQLLKNSRYDDALTMVKKYLEEDELIYYRLLIFKHQQEHNRIIDLDYLKVAMHTLSDLGNNTSSIKTYALLAEILFRGNQIELANHNNDLAFEIWKNGSMEFNHLAHIIRGLKAQHQSNKAIEILDQLAEELNFGDDSISQANCRFEINQLKYILLSKAQVEDDGDHWFEPEELSDSNFDLNAVRTAVSKFLSRTRSEGISNEIVQKGTIHSMVLCNRLKYHLTLDSISLKNELFSLRSQLQSNGSFIHTFRKSSKHEVIPLISEYCALSQAFFINQELELSEEILDHAITIAKNQFDSYHPSALEFSAGPKYECLYLVCYHQLIQGKIDSVNKILEEMKNTYQSFDNQFNLYSLCDDTLTWMSTFNNYRLEILDFLYTHLTDRINSAIEITCIKYSVRILEAVALIKNKYYALDKLNQLLITLKKKTLPRELKEICIVEICNGLLVFDGLDTVSKTINSIEFSERNLDELHERIASFYLKEELDFIKLFSKMKAHGRWLPAMNMKNILDQQMMRDLTMESVIPVIYLFSVSPENLDLLLSQFSLK